MAQEKQGIWIARDKNGEIHGFIVKPIRGKDKWEDNYRISDDNFDWSKWHTEFTWENEPIICMVGMISVIVVGYMMLSVMR